MGRAHDQMKRARVSAFDRRVVTLWTSLGLWLPTDDGVRRVCWHLVSKASWQNSTLVLVEATETAEIDGIVRTLRRKGARP